MKRIDSDSKKEKILGIGLTIAHTVQKVVVTILAQHGYKSFQGV